MTKIQYPGRLPNYPYKPPPITPAEWQHDYASSANKIAEHNRRAKLFEETCRDIVTAVACAHGVEYVRVEGEKENLKIVCGSRSELWEGLIILPYDNIISAPSQTIESAKSLANNLRWEG